MKKKYFVPNKYTFLVLILLGWISSDVLVHKGNTRVLLPENFTAKRLPMLLERCEQPLIISNKKWIKAVDTISIIEKIPANAAGIEIDVYFDTAKNQLQVYHDSTRYAELTLETLLKIYKSRNLTASIWLDFKNLSEKNELQSLVYITNLRQQYQLNNKLIIESSLPKCLQSFCNNGFFTSYYTPFFNPYQIPETALIGYIDTISSNLKRYPTSALSGYYFQYPFLKKYFPDFPILTWADNPGLSLPGNIFDRVMQNDKQLKVVLYNSYN